MPTFSAPDGTQLSYQVTGDGEPLVCLPGGPMKDSRYLDDLGGLSRHRQLIMLDLRGTGQSAIPEDASSYRCDRLVDDVEALREHLGLDRMDLLGHSAGVNLATLYAARFPAHVRKLALINPSTFAVGITITGETRLDTARLRKNEPWFPTAFAALEAVTGNRAGDEDWAAIDPFFHGRWDATAREHQATFSAQPNPEAARTFASEGAFNPEATRTALATFPAPVLLLAGEFDVNSPPPSVAEYAGLFPDASLVVQPGAGHYPWLDDADLFVATLTTFLRS
ncbi:pimeloyl-ACP methyl ester carboxylesterase [Micromonospora pisi]|uniref:Pimeloyl-ACP methyl ester carboxylesterase n=1 Tax=Micromonospora pisi TaxID=589240 RepID=A0A495JAX4_9ACTN|nr:alpha/beta hydrolase [Micromonospora pisi]RKR85871.1 pimeloyl-ACP methyl ester carboxylesterase [Micromonospora pisi]